MTNNQNKFIRRKIDEKKEEFGGKCWNCGSIINLQFAHIKETDLRGMGRGRKERYYDIIAHPDCYALLCGGESGRDGCHNAYDNGQLEISEFFDLNKLSYLKGEMKCV